MARHRQPLALARLKGSDKRNPQRYGDTVPASGYALGLPPEHLTPAARGAWLELETYALQGVLTGSDRIILEITSVLLAQFRSDPAMPASKIGHLVGCVARLGLSPADRQKLGLAKAAEVNEFDQF